MSLTNQTAPYSTVSTILERKRSARSLVALLQGCEGRTVTVELRDETAIHGQMSNVDSLMNIEMLQATVYWRHRDRQPSTGTHIRFVHLPDYTDCIGVLQKRLKQLAGGDRRLRGGRREMLNRGRPRPLTGVGDDIQRRHQTTSSSS